MADNARRKLFVGIDYGTTYSGPTTPELNSKLRIDLSKGIAYALPTVSDGKDVEVVSNWPGRQGTNNELLEKVPSRIAYLRKDARKTPGDAKPTLWGYEVKPSSNYTSYSWTKLLLDEQVELAANDGDLDLIKSQEHGLLRLPQDKSAEEVASDFLNHLYDHCMATLEKHYAEFLAMAPIEFWFTMPNIWSPQAQAATRSAAKTAGFGSRPLDTIHMITEPHAGVLAAMKTQIQIAPAAFEASYSEARPFLRSAIDTARSIQVFL